MIYSAGSIPFPNAAIPPNPYGIPFCLNFPNILTLNNAKYGLIRAEIHLKDWNSIQGNAIDVQLDKDNFINESRDGYIVYCFCKGKEKNATKI